MRPVGPDGLPSPACWKLALLGTLALGSLFGALFYPSVPQDPAYHRFADARTLLGIPNCLNVLSNLPLLAAGLCGLRHALRLREEAYLAPWARGPWIVLTASLLLSGLGSSYYHWAPTDATLFWDRLPMAMGFSSLLGILLIERVDLPLGRRLWAPLVLAALGSLIFWRLGGDLRFYGLLQGWALVFTPLILILFPGRYTRGQAWFAVLAFYGLAKAFELADAPVYRIGSFVSGHSLKHLSAGVAAFLIARHLGTRARTNSSDAAHPGAA
jgi:hypothetical protein